MIFAPCKVNNYKHSCGYVSNWPRTHSVVMGVKYSAFIKITYMAKSLVV